MGRGILLCGKAATNSEKNKNIDKQNKKRSTNNNTNNVKTTKSKATQKRQQQQQQQQQPPSPPPSPPRQLITLLRNNQSVLKYFTSLQKNLVYDVDKWKQRTNDAYKIINKKNII